MYLGSVKDWLNQQHGQITRGDFSFFFLDMYFSKRKAGPGTGYAAYG
jgi:hypothetical protein